MAALAAPSAQQQPPSPPPRFREAVTVERIVVDVRVVDDSGQPVPGLAPEDFKVKLDGKPVLVESALWVGVEEDAGVVVTPEDTAAAPANESAQPRLVVFFLQRDLEPSRIVGLLKILQKVDRLLGVLAPGDRAAALLFDTALWRLQDFTDDRARVRRAIEDGIVGRRRAVQEGEEPSLFAQLDDYASRRAASPERALQVVGEALQELPGAKTLVFLGWGIGRFGRGGVSMTPDYEPARHALQKARCSVFALDITEADYHSLEVGLIQVAEDTGGFYAKTHLFPEQALKRMERALQGYYVLSFERPEGKPGSRRLDVSLNKRKGTLMAPNAVG
jgi:VWFA-related protein